MLLSRRSLHAQRGANSFNCSIPGSVLPALQQVNSCRTLKSGQAACSSREGGSEPVRHPEASESETDSTWRLPFMAADTDWREFRAKLVASERASVHASEDSKPYAACFTASEDDTVDSNVQRDQGSRQEPARWAHSIPRPEKGCLLLAHPMMFRGSQQYFYQAVILILEHNEKQSYGVILNRPSMYTLKELNLTQPLPEFDACTLYVGGDVGSGELTCLHTHPGLEGSEEIVRGVYVGGVRAAQDAVQRGDASPDDFRFLAKYAGWGPGQLESECARGVWFTAAASPSVIISPPTASDGSDSWHAVLQLMGDDFKKLSENVKRYEDNRSSKAARFQAAKETSNQDDNGASA